MEWKSIETAPEETPILVWTGKRASIARYRHGDIEPIERSSDNNVSYGKRPTHWMFLPLPPKDLA